MKIASSFFIFAVKDILHRNLIEAYKDSKHIPGRKIPLLKVSNTSQKFMVAWQLTFPYQA